MQGTAGLCFNLLYLLQTPAGDKQAAGCSVMGQHLAKLTHHMLENVGWSIMEKRLKGRQVDALLEDVLQSLFGL